MRMKFFWVSLVAIAAIGFGLTGCGNSSASKKLTINVIELK